MTLQAESKTRVTSGIWLDWLDVFMAFGREGGFKKRPSKNERKKLSLLELNQRYCLAERRYNFYLHMLANIPESR